VASVGLVPPSASPARKTGRLSARIFVANIEYLQKMERGKGPATWCEQVSFLHGMERFAPSCGVDFEIAGLGLAVQTRLLPREDYQGIHRNAVRFQSNKENPIEK
jgi:hypothetical protein